MTFTRTERFQRAKEDAARMTRKELNIAFAHMYCDQHEYEERIRGLIDAVNHAAIERDAEKRAGRL